MNRSFVSLNKYLYYKSLTIVYIVSFLYCGSMYLLGWFGPLAEEAKDIFAYFFMESIFNPIDLAVIVPMILGLAFSTYAYLKQRKRKKDEMLMLDYAMFKGIYLCAIIFLSICIGIVFSFSPSGMTSLLRFLFSMFYIPVIFQYAYVVYHHRDAHNRIDLPKYKDTMNE